MHVGIASRKFPAFATWSASQLSDVFDLPFLLAPQQAKPCHNACTGNRQDPGRTANKDPRCPMFGHIRFVLGGVRTPLSREADSLIAIGLDLQTLTSLETKGFPLDSWARKKVNFLQRVHSKSWCWRWSEIGAPQLFSSTSAVGLARFRAGSRKWHWLCRKPAMLCQSQ